MGVYREKLRHFNTGTRKVKTVFINAPLSTMAEGRLNDEIDRIVKGIGFRTYLPQANIPPGLDVDPLKVIRANIVAVRKSDLVLTVLDKPGLGVAFELGYSVACKKKVIAFRTDPQDYLGKVVEGFWKDLPKESKATTFMELELILRKRV